MELNELNADDRLALVGLVKTVLLSDRRISEDELEEVREIVEAFGQDEYEAALDTFETRFNDEESFREFLATVSRQDARELIYGTILQGASADAIEGRESDLLSWLEKTWNIEVTIAEPPEGDDSPG